VQRALTEYGYGQLKATGTVGSDTQAAISKFERERKLPITGQVSDRLVRELNAMIGHPVD
jgi:peptidoglycan hydrolase-like protein with peptidoglycan-binding domain